MSRQRRWSMDYFFKTFSPQWNLLIFIISKRQRQELKEEDKMWTISFFVFVFFSFVFLLMSTNENPGKEFWVVGLLLHPLCYSHLLLLWLCRWGDRRQPSSNSLGSKFSSLLFGKLGLVSNDSLPRGPMHLQGKQTHASPTGPSSQASPGPW